MSDEMKCAICGMRCPLCGTYDEWQSYFNIKASWYYECVNRKNCSFEVWVNEDIKNYLMQLSEKKWGRKEEIGAKENLLLDRVNKPIITFEKFKDYLEWRNSQNLILGEKKKEKQELMEILKNIVHVLESICDVWELSSTRKFLSPLFLDINKFGEE